jgi:SAM-dependent methyltransferase
MSTDDDWEAWGRRDPYFGVITDPKFRRDRMTEEAKREFFESGRVHADYVLAMIRRHIDAGFAPGSILDFGCGVGRLLIPFAAIANEVVGVDVSPSMLTEARKNCDARGLGTVRLAVSSDDLSALAGTFDLVHSFIVFQHVPAERGAAIFGALLRHIAPGGIGAFHFSYSKSQYAATRGIAPLSTLAQESGRPERQRPDPRPDPRPEIPQDPEIQMNPYNMNELLFLLQESGVRRFHAEFTDHGGELGVFLFFQRPAAP